VRASAAAAAALLLAACGGQDGNRAGGATNNASAFAAGEPGASGAAPAPAAPVVPTGESMQPGQWEMVTLVRSIEVPGAPPEVQARIRGQVGQSQTNQNCITPEEARNPLGQMQQMMARGQARCRFSDQVFAGGVIRIGATCPTPGGQGSVQISMAGTFTATALQATLAVNTQGGTPGTPGAGVRMSAELRGRRVGECRARPAPPAIRAPVPAPPQLPRP
jgi:hypothetical protein